MSVLTGRAVPLPPEGGIEEVFAAAVRRDPTRAATATCRQVDADGVEVNSATYAQLDACVFAVAAALRRRFDAENDVRSEHKPTGDRVVAICMEPCVERVAAIFALWRLGVAFLPLDADATPIARALDLLRESGATAILTYNQKCAAYAELVASGLNARLQVVKFETLFDRELFALRRAAPTLRTPGAETARAPPSPPSSPVPQAAPTSRSFSNGSCEHREPETCAIASRPLDAPATRPLESALGSSPAPYEQYVLKFSEAARLFGRYRSDCESVGATRKQSLAAVLYTSGSSGRPKGVRLTRANLLSRLHWQWAELPFDARDTALLKTSLLFVDALSETFAATGALVNAVIAPSEIVKSPDKMFAILERYCISRLLMVPSPWSAFLSYARPNSAAAAGALASLRTLVLSGEALTRSLVDSTFALLRELRVASAGFRIVNLYGSTETTGDVAYELFAPPAGSSPLTPASPAAAAAADEEVPVGGPMWNTELYVIGDDGELVEEGSVGQLYVCGAHVADGYVDGAQVERDAADAGSPFTLNLKSCSDPEKCVRTGAST